MKKVLSWHKLLICAVMLSSGAQAQIIDSFWSSPTRGIVVDASGNAYKTLWGNISKRTPGGVVSTVAGVGVTGYSGDGGPATAAHIVVTSDLAMDGSGNLYFIDGYRIRKISASGIITTIAGTGVAGYSGDGGPATAAQTTTGDGITVDAAGNIYVTTDSSAVRKINASGVITTFAGNGTTGYSGDGGPATAAQLSSSLGGVFADNFGNIFISDWGNNRIRKVSASGIITTVAGNGTSGYSGDGGPATAAQLNYPRRMAVDGGGNMFIADAGNNRVRKVAVSGIISTFAGTGVNGCSGDGGPAITAQLWGPEVIGLDASGYIYVGVNECNKIKKITPKTTGISDFSQGEGLSIIPTVNSGTFVVKSAEVGSDELTLEVTNLLGQSVYSNSIRAKGRTLEHQVRLDNSLPAGIYVVTIRSASAIRSEKFVLAR